MLAGGLVLAAACQQPEPDHVPDATQMVAYRTATPTATATATPTATPTPSPTPSPTPIPPTPTPTPEPVSAPYTLPPYTGGAVSTGDVERWRELVASVFPASAVEAVLRVMACESGGNPNATGAAGEMGLMQIHPRYHSDATYDPLGNLQAAYRISSGGTDWSAWTCRYVGAGVSVP